MATIHYPKSSAVTRYHRVLLVTLGGAAGSVGAPDLYRTLARDMSWPAAVRRTVLGVHGYPRPGGSLPRGIHRRLERLIHTMALRSGRRPRIILVGKSLGGDRLHKVARLFDDNSVRVDLFVGIDVVSRPGKHWNRYWEKGRERHVRYFGRNVKRFVNFAQDDDRWTGHPLAYEGSRPRRHNNINVREDHVGVDVNGKLVRNTRRPLCPSATHKTIDTCTSLATAVKRLVRTQVWSA